MPFDRLTEQIEAFSTSRTPSGEQLGVYLAGRFKVAAPLTLETGMRYDHTSYAGDKLWSPRLSAVYSLAAATFLRAGWGYYHQTQGINELRVQFREQTYHEAERAEHFVFGLEHLFPNGLSLRAGAYHKRMSKLQDEYYSFHDIDEFFPGNRSGPWVMRPGERGSRWAYRDTAVSWGRSEGAGWW